MGIFAIGTPNRPGNTAKAIDEALAYVSEKHSRRMLV